MPEFTVTFAESALRDLAEIRNWYAEQAVAEVGDRLVAEIFQLVERLVDHPDMRRVVPEFDQSFLRELIHAPFRIVYRRDSEPIRVVRVWRSDSRLRLSPSSRRHDKQHHLLCMREKRSLEHLSISGHAGVLRE